MKKFYVDVRDFEKNIVTAAIESGVDALVADDPDIEKIKKLSVVQVIASKGDIKLGKDILEIEIKNKEDEAKAMELVKKNKVIARIHDWKIIPLEDLIASNPKNVFCYVKRTNRNNASY